MKKILGLLTLFAMGLPAGAACAQSPGPVNTTLLNNGSSLNANTAFGIVCDGATDNTAAFAAMNTYMIAHPGSIISFTPGTGACQYHSSTWLSGVQNATILGNGASFQNSSPSGGYGYNLELVLNTCDWFSCANTTYPTFCPINSATAGATTITTTTASCAANITPGTCLYLGGYNQAQTAGYPPDLRYSEVHCNIVSSNSSTGVITLQDTLRYSYSTSWLAGNPVNGQNMGPPIISSLNRAGAAPFNVTKYINLQDMTFLCAVNYPSDCYANSGSGNTGYGGVTINGVLNAHLSNVKIGYLDATTLGNIVIDRGSVIVSAALDKDSGTVTIRDSTVGNIAAGDGFTNVMLDNDIFGFNGETSTTCAITQLNSRQFSVTHSQFYCDVASGGFFNLNNDLPISNAVISGNNFWNTNGNISYGVGVGAPQSFTVLTVPTSLSVTYAQSNYRANGILIGNSLATTASGKQCVVSAEPIASSGSMLLTFTSCTATPVIGDVFKVNVIQSLTETSNSWTGVQGQMIVSAAGPYSLPVDRLYADSKDWVRIYNASNWPIPACSHTFTATTVGYGAEVTVGDSTSSTFGATYVPGGVNYEKVSCNGSHWVIY